MQCKSKKCSVTRVPLLCQFSSLKVNLLLEETLRLSPHIKSPLHHLFRQHLQWNELITFKLLKGGSSSFCQRSLYPPPRSLFDWHNLRNLTFRFTKVTLLSFRELSNQDKVFFGREAPTCRPEKKKSCLELNFWATLLINIPFQHCRIFIHQCTSSKRSARTRSVCLKCRFL